MSMLKYVWLINKQKAKRYFKLIYHINKKLGIKYLKVLLYNLKLN